MTHYVLKAPLNLFDNQKESNEQFQLKIAKRYLNMLADAFHETSDSDPDFRVTFMRELAQRGLAIMNGTREPYPNDRPRP